MADIYDQATDREMRDREIALANIRAQSSTKPKLPVVGTCYNCGELISSPKTFCDSDCYDDWKKRCLRHK